MSYEITTAFVDQFKANILLLSQQKQSLLRAACRMEPVTGDTMFLDRVAATTAQAITTRHGDTPLISTPHSRRKLTMGDYNWADLIDNADKLKMLSDPTSVYVQNAVAAFPRLSAELLPRALLRALWPARYRGRPTGDAPLRVESIIGALFAVRMAAVAEFGPLDEDFFFFLEETEWCHRAHTRGWETWHIPAARAVHAQGATAKKHNALARIEYHRSRLLYFRKTAPGRYALSYAIALTKAAFNALGNALLAGLTLGLAPRVRAKAGVDLKILAWYLQGRPADVGLPDKCPPGRPLPGA